MVLINPAQKLLATGVVPFWALGVSLSENIWIRSGSRLQERTVPTLGLEAQSFVFC